MLTVCFIFIKEMLKGKKTFATNKCLKGLTVTPADRWRDYEEEQMSINRWMHGRLPCTIYSGGSVSVCCQQLGCLSIITHTHMYTHSRPTTMDFPQRFTRLSVGFHLYGCSQIQRSWYLPSVFATSSSEPREDVKLQVGTKIYAGTLSAAVFYIWGGETFFNAP